MKTDSMEAVHLDYENEEAVKQAQQIGASAWLALASGEANQLNATNALSHLTDLQVRDFALGVIGTATPNIQALISAFIDYSISDKNPDIDAPLHALRAYAYLCEGNTDKADLELKACFSLNSDYSLARLFERTLTAGWETDFYPKMAQELHPKVSDKIFG